MANLRLAGIVKESIVDGKGIRFVVFVQGCPHHCEGCHNPQTHSFQDGYDMDTDEILEQIKVDKLLSGVTFSGGEPFCQPAGLVELAKEVKKLGLNVVTYSGYTFEQLCEMGKDNPSISELLNECDFLIDGKFILEQKNPLLRFRGSDNQRIIDLKASLKEGAPIQVEW